MTILHYCTILVNASSQIESFARSSVAAFCSLLNPTLEEINDIKTAVSEAVNNCVVHAYGRKEGQIEINVELYENAVQIAVRDKGCGFDNIQEAMQPFYTSKPQEERSGMGFTLMQAFMNEVEVDSQVGVGTSVVMRKQLGNANA